MSDGRQAPRARHGAIWSGLVAAACLLRGVPLFLRAAPRTPLRVLGIIALDMLHGLRRSRLMPRQQIRAVALFLDFAGCMNAAWDRKERCAAEYRAARLRLEQAGLGACITGYLNRLQAIERWRPAIGGDHRRFAEVRSYREAVARLTLATAAEIALNDESLEDGDLDTMFRALMECQIIDDVLDYTEDLAAGLPSFLTAVASREHALALTADAADAYAERGERWPGHAEWPLRVALWVASALAQTVVRVADQRTFARLAGI